MKSIAIPITVQGTVLPIPKISKNIQQVSVAIMGKTLPIPQTTLVDETEEQRALREDKWIRTRKCGCGECAMFLPEERPVCPARDAPHAVWLWRLNTKFIGMKDYTEEGIVELSTEDGSDPNES